MNKLFSILIIFVCCSNVSFSDNIVDIYGTEKSHGEAILKKYSKQVAEIQSELTQENLLSEINGKENTKKIELIGAKKALLIKKIKKNGSFLFVNFSTVTYFSNEKNITVPMKNTYTTLEVIDNKDPDRLRFVGHDKKKNPGLVKDDLINKMIEYGEIAYNLLMNKQLNSNDMECPVYHCVDGFENQKLKPFLNVFNTGVLKEKKLIVDTLNHDPDPERRAAAAFLIGHLSDPKEILSILLPHVNDRSALVRNNVMRVIGATTDKAKISTIDVTPFLDLLNSPYGTDRNKASGILLNASATTSSKSLIIQKGKDNLLAMLRLKQLNNHEYAWLILKKISGKTYGEYDIEAWDKWLTSAQNKLQKKLG